MKGQTLIEKQDYNLPKDSTVWVIIGNYSVRISYIFIDVFELGKECNDPIERIYIN